MVHLHYVILFKYCVVISISKWSCKSWNAYSEQFFYQYDVFHIWCFHTFNMAIKLKRWYCYRIHFKCIERIVKMRKEYKTMMQKSLSFLYSKLILYWYWQRKRVGSPTWFTYFLQVCLKDSNNGLIFFYFVRFIF